jgi:hypothetical protein
MGKRQVGGKVIYLLNGLICQYPIYSNFSKHFQAKVQTVEAKLQSQELRTQLGTISLDKLAEKNQKEIAELKVLFMGKITFNL